MLTRFGFVAVLVMFVAYTQDSRSRWLVLLFAAGTAATALYSGMVEAYPKAEHAKRTAERQLEMSLI